MASATNIAVITPAASDSRSVSRLAWFTVVYNIAVILWGAYVRASGSGAGCGSRWPLCNGDILPGMAQPHTVIEFLHRAMSGLALVMMFVLLLRVWRKTRKGAWPRYSAIVATLLLLNEALLGALLVLLDHVGVDRSTGHAFFLCLHFANTLLLLASLALTAHWLSRGDRRFVLAANRREIITLALGLAFVMFIGITGSLAALSDTVFPPKTLPASLMQDFSSQSHLLLRLRPLHPFVALMGALYVLWLFVRLSENRDRSRWTLPILFATLALQIGSGALNVILLAPVWLQLAHLFIADLFWIFLVLASTDVLLAGAGTHPSHREAPDAV
jgi:heme a synthase